MTRVMTLGEVGSYFNGRAFKPSDWSGEGLPIIQIANLNDASVPFHYFLGEVRAEQRVDDGDLLVSWSASLDAYIWHGGPALVNQHIFKVYERPMIVDRTYLWYALRSVMRGIRTQVHGATMQHITKPEFEAISIPVPQLEVQRRIAAQLTAQLASADRARTAIISRSSMNRKIAVAMVERRLVPDATSGWDRPALATLLRSPLRTGISAAEVPDGLSGLSLAAVRNGQLDLTPSKRVDVDASTNRLVREGCFYIVRGNGRLDLVGRAGLAPRPTIAVVFPDLLIEADLDPDKVHPEFFQLAGTHAKFGPMSRVAHGQPRVSTRSTSQNLGRVCVPIPSLGEQRRIAAELRERLAMIDAMEASIRAEQEAIDALPAALLRRAFDGLAA